MAPPPHPLRYLDFYRCDDGRLGVAWAHTGDSYMEAVTPGEIGSINLLPIDEYLDDHFGKPPTYSTDPKVKSYSRRIDHDRDAFFDGLGFVRPEQAPWILPSEPSKPLKEWEASTETGSLLHELTRYFNTFVRFPSGVFAETCAVWTLASAIPERVTYAPPLAYVGPPRSGKSRAVRALRLVCRRGMNLGAPSPASLYALADSLAPTICVDEWTALAMDIRHALETIIRLAFEKGNKISRRKERSQGIAFYDPFCFLGLASREPLPDDVVDRSIEAIMSEAHDVPNLALDNAQAAEMRTAVLRYRLEVLAGQCHRPLVSNTESLVRAELATREGKALSDRGLNKAQTLAQVAASFDAVSEVVDSILQSEIAGKERFAETHEAWIYAAVKRLYPTAVTLDGVPSISLRDLHDEIWRDLQDGMGYTARMLENHDPVLPERLGPQVRQMGIRTDRATSGMRIHDPELKTKLEALAWKYERPL